MNQRTDFDACFTELFQKLLSWNWAIWCLNILFWFPNVTINLTKAEITYNFSGSDLINDYEYTVINFYNK